MNAKLRSVLTKVNAHCVLVFIKKLDIHISYNFFSHVKHMLSACWNVSMFDMCPKLTLQEIVSVLSGYLFNPYILTCDGSTQ